MNYKFYPVIIFTYNRPNYLLNLIQSIKKNKNYTKHKYFFFCDGAKKSLFESDFKKIAKCLKIIDQFKINKKVFKRSKNYGLAKNIIDGVSNILNSYNAAIVLEDDLELNHNCLEFINNSLNIFKKDKSIGSVSGYSYAHNINGLENIDWYKTYRHCSWSWGTWKNRWEKIDWNLSKYKSSIKKSNNFRVNIKKVGDDIPILLEGQKLKLINSWAVRFNYHCLLNNLHSLNPRYSLTKNIGYGPNSTHTLNIFKKENIVLKKKKFKFENKSYPKFYKKINNYIYNKNKKSIKLEFRIFLKKLLRNFL